MHVGSSVVVAFCTFSKALRPIVGAGMCADSLVETRIVRAFFCGVGRNLQQNVRLEICLFCALFVSFLFVQILESSEDSSCSDAFSCVCRLGALSGAHFDSHCVAIEGEDL